MLAPWLELPDAADLIADWSAASGLDLARLGTVAERSEIADTAVTQPLIVAATLLGARELRRHGSIANDVVIAGHSIGEVSALALAGVLSEIDAVRLAAARGAAMARACAEQPTSMLAVLGGREADVLLALESAGLVAANRNGAGQIVAAGPQQACDALAANPPSRTRIRPIDVAGAFHTTYMASAVDEVRQVAATLTVSNPSSTLLSNADGTVVHDGHDALDRIATQITQPVRWDLCTQTMLKLGVDSLIELPPAGTLAGIAKRQMPGVTRLALNEPNDLVPLLDPVSAHTLL